MATSPNFSWPEPDNTDLVKNGALAIRTAVDAIDSSMADLKGGTTGQVLTKASGTDMDFTWSTASGGSNQFYAGKNKIINGDFYINQRSFTSNTSSGSFNFDRWSQINNGGSFTVTPQTFTPGTAPVSGYEGKTYVQGITASQSASGDYAIFDQKIEDVRTFAGQTVTVSFWAKAASGTPKIGVELAQQFGTGGTTPGVFTAGGAVTLSTSWARYSVTISVPSVSGKTITTGTDSCLELLLWVSAGATFATRASSIGIQNNTFQIWGVQIEAGSSATSFQTATGTIQGELAACQRYYWRTGPSAGAYGAIALGFASSTTNVMGFVRFPVTMRTSPTSIDYSTLQCNDSTIGAAVSAVAFSGGEYSPDGAYINFTTGSMTQFRPTKVIVSNSTTGYLALNAEL